MWPDRDSNPGSLAYRASTLPLSYLATRSTGYIEKIFLKVFAIYSHGGHLGHVTWTIYINFSSPFLRMLHMIGQAASEKIF